jgi:hypothetical protein
MCLGGAIFASLQPALAQNPPAETSKAKDKAKKIGCLNNLKQMGLSTMLYADDSNGDLVGDTLGTPGQRTGDDDDVNNFTLTVHFSNRGMRPGPTRMWLFEDADDVYPSLPGSIDNWLDPTDNHGAAGLNVICCDGHANWVSAKNQMNEMNISFDENRTGP